MILYAASDLLWASKIKATADAFALAARPVRTIEMLEARLADSQPRLLLVDLDIGASALAMITRLKGPGASDQQRAIRVVAFGPHVATELLGAARDAGADEVLTRGAMNNRLAEVLARRE